MIPRSLLRDSSLGFASGLPFLLSGATLSIWLTEEGVSLTTIDIENLSGGMGSAAFVAYLSLLCNKAHTGTQFALFTSFMAFGRTWLSAMSGWVAEQTDWVFFFITSTFVAIPGLLLLLWMLKHLPMSEQAGPDRSS